MRGWLAADYRTAIGRVEQTPALYALWRPDESDGIHLRHFFVAREFRRRGLGRAALHALHADFWPGRTVSLDVLVHNERGIAFWRSLGFQDYALALRRPPT